MNIKNVVFTTFVATLLFVAQAFLPLTATVQAKEPAKEVKPRYVKEVDLEKDDKIYVVTAENTVMEMTKEQADTMKKFEDMKTKDVLYMPFYHTSNEDVKALAFFDYKKSKDEEEQPFRFFLQTEKPQVTEGELTELPRIHFAYDNFYEKDAVELTVTVSTEDEEEMDKLVDSELSLVQKLTDGSEHSLGTFFGEKAKDGKELVYTLTITESELKDDEVLHAPKYFIGTFEGQTEVSDEVTTTVTLDNFKLLADEDFTFDAEKHAVSSDKDPLAVVKTYEDPSKEKEEVEVIEKEETEDDETPAAKDEETEESEENVEDEETNATEEEEEKESAADSDEEEEVTEPSETTEEEEDAETFLLDEEPEDMSLEQKHGTLPQMNTKTTLIPLIVGVLLVAGAIYYRKRQKN